MPTKGSARNGRGRTPARTETHGGASKGATASSRVDSTTRAKRSDSSHEGTEEECSASSCWGRGRRKQSAKVSKGISWPRKSASPSQKKGSIASKNGPDDDHVNKVLLKTLNELRIRKVPRSECTAVINEIVDNIVKHLRAQNDCFNKVTRLRTGSYYENVKICQPDEFDVMLVIPVKSVDLRPFDDDGAFYSVAVKGKSRSHLLNDFVQENGVVSASKMLDKFRSHVKSALKRTGIIDVQVERKKKGSPAVTLMVKNNGLQIGLDVVLGLEVQSSWPPFTKDGFQIEKWLGTKVKRDFKFKPFYLVPKYERTGTEVLDGICAKDVWRISFSHVEKDILKCHGSAKTCCEAAGMKCCRRECLKLLKHLLHQLKEKYPEDLSKFCSYQAKSALFHACAERVHDSDWKMEHLACCFQQLLEDFQRQLRQGNLPNFFLPKHNLLGSKCDQKSCNFLADLIDYEQNNMFPIFE